MQTLPHVLAIGQAGGVLVDRIDDLGLVAARVRSCTFDKEQVLLRPGDVAHSVYFVKTGLLRLYHVIRAQERTRNFFSEGTLFTDSLSYFTRRPTSSSLEALEPTEPPAPTSFNACPSTSSPRTWASPPRP